MKLYRTTAASIVEHEGLSYSLNGANWDELITRDDLLDYLRATIGKLKGGTTFLGGQPLAPIGGQEVWAAGVTYRRSREARMEEAKAAGGGDFYDRVYDAERPELFFKSTPHRVAGPGESVAIRADSKWSVPEPELTLLVTPNGRITGYTIGNDMSSRDIEGENPLYLPQAKVYDRSCALGPCILVSSAPLPPATEILIEIRRGAETAFTGSTTLASLKRDPGSLVHYLFRHNSFPQGCFLLTGTGIVPPDSFALQRGDQIDITIAPIGTLTNRVS